MMESLPFVVRDDVLAQAATFLKLSDADRFSRALIIRGDSGSGKSRFANQLISMGIGANPGLFCVGMDLSEDAFASAHAFESLVALSWNSQRASPMRHVPKGSEFTAYLRTKSRGKFLTETLYRAIKSIASPILGPAAAALPESPQSQPGDTPTETCHVFIDYLAWVAKQYPAVVFIDNYQFLNRELGFQLETRLSRVGNVRMVIIDRTIGGNSSIAPALVLSGATYTIELALFTANEVRSLVRKCLPHVSSDQFDSVARDCFLKSNGNLKLAELYIRSIQPHRRDGSHAVAAAPAAVLPELLPGIARQVVLLAALFDTGLKRPHFLAILRRILAVTASEARVAETLEELVALGYLYLNGVAGELVRVHETVSHSMKNAASDDEILETRNLAISTFRSLLDQPMAEADYYHLIHCLVGLLHVREAVRLADRVAELIQYNYRLGRHTYISSLYRQQPELLDHLPEHIIVEVLDSLLKACEFTSGLIAIRRLSREGAALGGAIQLYAAKFHVQQHRHIEALSILDTIPTMRAGLIQRMIALQSLARDDEAREILVTQLERRVMDTIEYIMLRNGYHLLDDAAARSYLLEASTYFRRQRMTFWEGTVLNNIGIHALRHGDAESAAGAFAAAIDRFDEVGSRDKHHPIANWAVLDAIAGNFDAAAERLVDAHSLVPRLSEWGRVLYLHNMAIIDAARGRKEMESIVADLRNANETAIYMGDQHLVSLTDANCCEAESANGSPRPTPLLGWPSAFVVPVDVALRGETVTLHLGLNPIWRE